jgi:ubiquitin carboxyl-terminal hydrolase 4/11/15
MNSGLQCLSNVPPLTEYIFQNKSISESLINLINYNSNNIFKLYANLIRNIWSGNYGRIQPNSLKYNIAKIAPHFVGFGQQDCSEFLICLLNQMHVELNKQNKLGSNSNMQLNNFIEDYRIKNDTIISKLFHGFQTDSLICECKRELSINYMPFSIMNLCLPEINFNVSLVLDSSDVIYDLSLINRGNNFKVEVLLNEIKDLIYKQFKKDINPNNLILTQIINCRINKIYRNEDSFLKTSGELVVYEMDPNFEHHIFVTLIEEQDCTEMKSDIMSEGFGLPLLIKTNNTNNYIIDINNALKQKLFAHERLCASNESNDFDHIFTDLYENNELEDNKTFRVFNAEIPNHLSANYKLNKQSIRLKQTESIDINECLLQYILEERLSERESNKLYCDKCGLKTIPTKKVDLNYLPKVLIIQLKRFNYTPNRRYKVDTVIEFPIKDLNMEPYVKHNLDNSSLLYDLIAVSYHLGSLYGGHYIAVAKNYLNKKWYEFNDANVREINEYDIDMTDAYVLVYLKKD